MPSPLSRFTTSHERAGARRASRRIGVAGLVMLVAPLAACDGKAASEASSTTISQADIDRIAAAGKSAAAKASSSSAASSGSDAFVVPEAAKAHTHEGAKAFVKFYWEMLGQLDAHPQAGVIERFAAPTCESCTMQKDAGRQLLVSGASITAERATLSGLVVRADSTQDSVVVQYREQVSGRVKISKGGKTPLPPVNQSSAARADWTGNGWVLGEMGAN